MKITERRMQIYDLLKKNEIVEISELAKRFGVSTMTIRRDLSLLEKQGVLHRNYGEAYLNRQMMDNPGFTAKSSQHMQQKRLIGWQAAQFVQEGDTILLDSGTTVLQMLPFLGNKHVTIITCSWPAPHFIGNNPGIRLVLAPGEYSSVSEGVSGSLTIDFFSRLHADKVFMGGHGFCPAHGVTEPNLAHNSKKALMAAGAEKFLLIDSSKFGMTYLMQYANLYDFDHIITDCGYTASQKEELQILCKDVVFCDTCN